jgi:hypothetical protein
MTFTLQSLAEQAGAVFRGGASRCPLHGGDNPGAFRLYAGGTRWHCFTRCPQGENDGDLAGFYMRWKRVSYPQAVEALGLPPRRGAAPAASAAPPPPQPDPAWQPRAAAFIDYAEAQLHAPCGRAARAYLQAERGLRPETWEIFRLGFNPTTVYDDPARWGLAGDKKLWLPRGIVIPSFCQTAPGRIETRGIKIRRPLPGDLLAEYMGEDRSVPGCKFSSARGSQAAVFGAEFWLGFPVLLLVEGEFDAVLTWQLAHDLCDIATLGSASNRPGLGGLVELTHYRAVLSVYDDDPAGDQARQALARFARIRHVRPPAHDLTETWREGKDLRAWIASLMKTIGPRT